MRSLVTFVPSPTKITTYRQLRVVFNGCNSLPTQDLKIALFGSYMSASPPKQTSDMSPLPQVFPPWGVREVLEGLLYPGQDRRNVALHGADAKSRFSLV